jgi:hypothetical protein
MRKPFNAIAARAVLASPIMTTVCGHHEHD